MLGERPTGDPGRRPSACWRCDIARLIAAGGPGSKPAFSFLSALIISPSFERVSPSHRRLKHVLPKEDKEGGLALSVQTQSPAMRPPPVGAGEGPMRGTMRCACRRVSSRRGVRRVKGGNREREGEGM